MINRLSNLQTNVVGMALFLFNETVFFALLITAFIDYQASRTNNPSAAGSLDPGITLIFTFFLLASSFTVWMADRSLDHSNHRGVIIWLVVTILFGGVFLVGQGMEYAKLLQNNVTISTNLFGTTFFTLTGFHGFHVLVGLIMLCILAGFAIKGDFRSGKSSAMSAISLYWHFVDVVWVFIFSIVYLWAAHGFGIF